MQQVSLYNLNHKNYSYKPKFEGRYPTRDDLVTVMPFKARKLVKKMDKFIEDEWTEIKKSSTGFSALPFYTLTGKKNEVATIKPVYQGYNKYILFEITNDKNTERIMINRQNPDLFKFERTVETDFGYATTKSFNSAHERNEDIETRVGKYVEEYFPKVLPRPKVDQ